MTVPPTTSLRPLLRPVGLVAATYVFFLLFAEFALLQFCRSLGVQQNQAILGALGLGGIAGSLLAGWLYSDATRRRHLLAGFLGCGLAAAVAFWGRPHFPWLVVSAGGTGLALGWLTVTLASALPTLVPPGRLGLACGLGTGAAYACCNLPALFAAGPSSQTLCALGAVVAGVVLLLRRPSADFPRSEGKDGRGLLLALTVVIFTALVGLDSAAFHVIQTTPELKLALWTGNVALWGNAAAHFVAAVAAGLLLDCGRCRQSLAVGAALLLGACVLLATGTAAPALIRLLYVAGVSVYSTALVFYPAASGRPGVAALIYAVAGWLGSALGLGLTQEMQGITLPPLLAAAALIYGALALGTGRRALAVTVLGLCGTGLLLWLVERGPEPALTGVELGRATYVSEGCMHCHSNYVRPRVPGEELRWGPTLTAAEFSAQQPPLPGNRRQGPDLTRVGNRRSAEWQRLHLRNPRELNATSRMPAYAHLFAPGDPRGEALVSYLAQLGADTAALRTARIATWQPAWDETADATEAKRLFANLCAGCHGTAGRADGPLASRLGERPPDFARTAWEFAPPDHEALGLARTIKFGLPGGTMAGHEWLNDRQLAALVRLVQTLHAGAAPAK